jgi:hypothetical protein
MLVMSGSCISWDKGKVNFLPQNARVLIVEEINHPEEFPPVSVKLILPLK